MNRYLCIHCHFYQPARENPWLEAVELQDSAFPYHDWNERITAECYAPNADARILGASGKIVRIVSNYSRISFNFGATLLTWMEEKAPETYAAILEADRASQFRFGGHGSAIAQGHSHIILPLANQRDKVTQVRWGIRDFELRFGRKPEGMWLPETAVDTETLEVMAAEGISFTILSPYQASSVWSGESWDDVSGGRIDPTVPYRLSLPSGRSLSLFFYDSFISQAVAFEHLLARGDHFRARLEGGFAPHRTSPQLVHIATDGETYGHHHKYGEMALAYVLESVESDENVRLTNYGEFLALHPPQREVKIVEYSSWSCVHGVERWRADCGCQTGGGEGWNQKWRAPLRESLDWLRDEIIPRFATAAAAIFSDPWEARDRYIDVLVDRSVESIGRFLEATAIVVPATAEEKTRALMLMELQRYAMLMFTSCGWFFNDISGIETVQVILYATRVIQLARQLFGLDLEPELLDRLSRAESNLPDMESGKTIYLRFARRAIVDLPKVGAHYAVSSLFESYGERSDIYCYDVERNTSTSLESGQSRLLAGMVSATSQVTTEQATMEYGLLYLGDLNVAGGIGIAENEIAFPQFAAELSKAFLDGDFPDVLRQLELRFGRLSFSIRSLFRDQQRKILGLLWNSTLAEAEAVYLRLYEKHRPLMRFHRDLMLPLPPVLRITAEAAFNIQLQHDFEMGRLPIVQIGAILEEVKQHGIPLDSLKLSFTLQHTLELLAEQFERRPDEMLLDRLEQGILLTTHVPFPVNLWRVQNSYYRALQKRLQPDPAPSGSWEERLTTVGELLSIAPIARNGENHG